MTIKKFTLIALAQAVACGAVFAASPEIEDNALCAVNKTDAYVLETVAPAYPMEMLQLGKQGRALLMLRVDEQGEVCETRVVASSNELFGQAALKAVKKWYFQPGTVNGMAVPQTVMVPVDFQIEGLKTPALASL